MTGERGGGLSLSADSGFGDGGGVSGRRLLQAFVGQSVLAGRFDLGPAVGGNSCKGVCECCRPLSLRGRSCGFHGGITAHTWVGNEIEWGNREAGARRKSAEHNIVSVFGVDCPSSVRGEKTGLIVAIE